MEITSEERDAIKEQVIARGSRRVFALESEPDAEITEEDFLMELDAQERFYRLRKWGEAFVGISRFVSHLGELGYSQHSFRHMLNQLIDKGAIEAYKVPNPYNDEVPTTAIRRISSPIEELPTISLRGT